MVPTDAGREEFRPWPPAPGAGSHKFKTKYRVKNWATYEAALEKRGDVTFWFDEDAIGAWNVIE